ncbi:MAG: hypothetical protein GWP59_08710 [Chlamydiales bacterium]|nr:hypothetical protein [Chlamydiales bacterium]
MLVYNLEDGSFDSSTPQHSRWGSIAVNYLTLEVNENFEILYVLGYCPLIDYDEIDYKPENYSKNHLVVLAGEELFEGITFGVNDEKWPLHINKKEGWVCIGNPKLVGKKVIEFSPGSIAVLDTDELVALWLHPEKFPLL